MAVNRTEFELPRQEYAVANAAPLIEGPLEHVSLVHKTPVNKRCFTPSTIFKSAEESKFVRADALALGDMVMSREGLRVEVLWACPHPCQSEQLIKLSTANAQLTVTVSHRIAAPSTSGIEVVLAKNLQIGSWVMVGQHPQQIQSIKAYVDEIAVIELAFANDALVEAWCLPLEAGLVSLGQPPGEMHRTLTDCKLEQHDDDSNGNITSDNESNDPVDDVPAAGVGNTTMLSSGSQTPHCGRRNRRSRRRFNKAKRQTWRQRTPSP